MIKLFIYKKLLNNLLIKFLYLLNTDGLKRILKLVRQLKLTLFICQRSIASFVYLNQSIANELLQ